MTSEIPSLPDLVGLWLQDQAEGYHLREWHISPKETWRYLCAGLDGTRIGKVFNDHVELNTPDATSLRPEDPEFFDKFKKALRVAAPMHRY